MMADKLNMCRQTIIMAIKDLIAAGWIVKAKQWAGKHNLYVLQTPTPVPEQKKEHSGHAVLQRIVLHHLYKGG